MLVADVATYVRWRDSLPSVEGLPERDAWAIFEGAHDGRCAACRSVPDTGLRVDHCHVTGLVRGLLCNSCNTQAPSEFVHRALAEPRVEGPRPRHYLPANGLADHIRLYVQLPPAAVMGFRCMWDPDPGLRSQRSTWHQTSRGWVLGREIMADMLSAWQSEHSTR